MVVRRWSFVVLVGATCVVSGFSRTVRAQKVDAAAVSGVQSAPVSVIPGVVFSGSVDGPMCAFSTTDGRIIWDYNTAHDYETVNHVPAKGGSIDAAGQATADGLLITNSGYALWKGMPGNMLLTFSAK